MEFDVRFLQTPLLKGVVYSKNSMQGQKLSLGEPRTTRTIQTKVTQFNCLESLAEKRGESLQNYAAHTKP